MPLLHNTYYNTFFGFNQLSHVSSLQKDAHFRRIKFVIHWNNPVKSTWTLWYTLYKTNILFHHGTTLPWVNPSYYYPKDLHPIFHLCRLNLPLAMAMFSMSIMRTENLWKLPREISKASMNTIKDSFHVSFTLPLIKVGARPLSSLIGFTTLLNELWDFAKCVWILNLNLD